MKDFHFPAFLVACLNIIADQMECAISHDELDRRENANATVIASDITDIL